MEHHPKALEPDPNKAAPWSPTTGNYDPPARDRDSDLRDPRAAYPTSTQSKAAAKPTSKLTWPQTDSESSQRQRPRVSRVILPEPHVSPT